MDTGSRGSRINIRKEYNRDKERNPWTTPNYSLMGSSVCLHLLHKVHWKKENKIYLINKEIQKGAVAKSYMPASLLIYN